MKKYNRMPLIVISSGYYSFIPQSPGKSTNPIIQGLGLVIPQPQGPGPAIYSSKPSNEKN